MPDLELNIPNKVEELTTIAQALENFGDRCEWPLNQVLSLNLVIEELFTNIVFYGFSDKLEHLIHLQIVYEDGIVRMCLTDDGLAFNPLENEAPDTKLEVDERPIGGLGIHFVKNLMDEIQYERRNGKNILCMQKKII